MIRNIDGVLWNDGKVLRSEVFESYIEHNSYGANQSTVGIDYSGASVYNPIVVYGQTDSGYVKHVLTSSGDRNQSLYFTSSTPDFKKIYFNGAFELVYRISLSSNNPHYFRGDLVGFINQFPKLVKLYLYSTKFNQDVSGMVLPQGFENINIYDIFLYGDVNTIDNMSDLIFLSLNGCKLTGDLGLIEFNRLESLSLTSLPNLNVDINKLFSTSNIKLLYIYDTPKVFGDVSSIDVSSITSLSINVSNNINLIGDISNWHFNPELTYFSVVYRYFVGDISQWDFSNTIITSFNLNNQSSSVVNVIGDLSEWHFPSTINGFSLNGIGGVTALPDFSGYEFNVFSVYYCNGLNNINNLVVSGKTGGYNNISISNCVNLASDVGTLGFYGDINQLQLSDNKLYGDINDLIFSITTRYLSLNNNPDLTGDLSTFRFGDYLMQLNLGNTKVYGNLCNISDYNGLKTLVLSSTKVIMDLTTGVFNTNNISSINLDYVSGITGTLGNLIINNSVDSLNLRYSNGSFDASQLDVSKIGYLNLSYNNNMYGDVSDWFSGGTYITRTLYMMYNPLISGDTSNWSVDLISTLQLYHSPNITGRLKHNNVNMLYIYNTSIDSYIDADFNFSNLQQFQGQNTQIQGSLSGVTLSAGFRAFYIQNCSNVTGSNEFIAYLFNNRKYFTYSSPSININNIGDTSTGDSISMGDLGSYTQFSGTSNTYYWDLTEFEVNNLSDGLDYDGNGSNIPWNSKQKVYWMINARISSTNTLKRYVNYSITL